MSTVTYFSAFIFIAIGYISLTSVGLLSYSLLIFGFAVIPLLELLVPPSASKNEVKAPFFYDLILYLLFPSYIALLILFVATIGEAPDTTTLIGRISAMGLLCGIFGINMAHELGHHKAKFDQVLAQILLATAQYTHFFVEHNRGHHKNVGTPLDPATARKGESLYTFWLRVIPDSYKSAWSLESKRLSNSGKSTVSWQNALVRYAVFQVLILASVLISFGSTALLWYAVSAVIGILLLETINYIEHYGLMRKMIRPNIYEGVKHVHSWNSDHVMGRTLLFELTRHSHHHENMSIKYPNLESKGTNQLPTGYPGMMMLSLIPALWFKIMDKRLTD